MHGFLCLLCLLFKGNYPRLALVTTLGEGFRLLSQRKQSERIGANQTHRTKQHTKHCDRCFELNDGVWREVQGNVNQKVDTGKQGFYKCWSRRGARDIQNKPRYPKQYKTIYSSRQRRISHRSAVSQ